MSGKVSGRMVRLNRRFGYSSYSAVVLGTQGCWWAGMGRTDQRNGHLTHERSCGGLWYATQNSRDSQHTHFRSYSVTNGWSAARSSTNGGQMDQQRIYRIYEVPSRTHGGHRKKNGGYVLCRKTEVVNLEESISLE